MNGARNTGTTRSEGSKMPIDVKQLTFEFVVSFFVRDSGIL
jgi:hypothetical protein